MDLSATEPHSRLDAAWSYQPDSALYDELLAPDGQIRPHWQTLVDSLAGIGTEGLSERWREGQRLIRNHGMTYNIYGGDPQSPDRPWPLDPIPLILHPGDWAKIEAAVTQRATLLNSILADLYGPQRLLRENLLPRELIFQHPAYLRSCCGVSVPGGFATTADAFKEFVAHNDLSKRIRYFEPLDVDTGYWSGWAQILALGVDYFILDCSGFPNLTTLELLVNEVIPALRD
jgi:hypothetical protein